MPSWQNGVGGGSGHFRILIELFREGSFLGNWGWRGALNLAEGMADRLGGGGGRLGGGEGKDGCLEVIDSSWIGAWGDNGLMEDFKDLGPT